MDSLSQFLLGAAIGQAFFTKEQRFKAFIIGGMLATLPDLDVFLNPSENFVEQLKTHRGLSHSLLFCILAPFPAAFLCRFIKFIKLPYWKSILFFFLVFSTHVFLDVLTSWGTQIFWPHPARISLDSLFIIDPLVTLPLLMGCLAQLMLSKQRFVYIGLFSCFFYCFFAISMHASMTKLFKGAFSKRNIPIEAILVRPTPFNTLFWSATVISNDQLITSHARIWDREKNITFSKPLARNSHKLTLFKTLKDADFLLNLSRGFYVLDSDNFIIHDARFDNLGSWLYPLDPIFVFNYHYSNTSQHWTQVRPEINNIQSLLSSLFSRIFSKHPSQF